VEDNFALCFRDFDSFFCLKKCMMVDPLAHGASHWEFPDAAVAAAAGLVCSSCPELAVAVNARSKGRYCEQCFTTDASRLIEHQFTYRHPPVKAEDLKRMRTSLGTSDWQIKKWLKSIQYP